MSELDKKIEAQENGEEVKDTASLEPSKQEESVRPVKELPVLHGFRVLFIFLVGNFHIWQQSWLWPGFRWNGQVISLDFLARAGYVFVDGMVLISALLLFLPYVREQYLGHKPTPLKTWYVKRFARLIPSYYACVLILFFFYMYPKGRYGLNIDFAWKDLSYHLLLLHTFDAKTYFSTNLGAGLWTIVILAQGYLFMPHFVPWIRKKPLFLLLGMFLLGNAFRYLVLQFPVPEIRFWMNQLPAFLDIYALGYAMALLFVTVEKSSLEEHIHLGFRLLSTICFFVVLYGITYLLKYQASAQGHDMLMINQVRTRLPFELLFALAIVFASYAIKPLIWLLSNKLMVFLSTISYNFYIWHQVLAVELRINLFDTDYMRSNNGLQMAFTLLCWSLAILLSAFMTYYVEKPANTFILTQYQRRLSNEGPKNPETRTHAHQLLHFLKKR